MTKKPLCTWAPMGSWGVFSLHVESTKEWIDDPYFPRYRRSLKHRSIDWMDQHIPGFAKLHALYIYHAIYKQLKPRLDKPKWLDRFDHPPVDVNEEYMDSLPEPTEEN